MSTKKLVYGLNITKKKGSSLGKPRPTAFANHPSDDEETTPLENTRGTAIKAVNSQLALTQPKKCIPDADTDPSVFDYDGIYDQMKQAEKDGLKKQRDENGDGDVKKPRYIQGLLRTAEIRKIDHLRAEERKYEREREAEGDEFKGSETFVTGSYKAHKEELERQEEEERRKAAAEAGKSQTNFSGFYRTILDQSSATRQAAVEASMSSLSKSARIERPTTKTTETKPPPTQDSTDLSGTPITTSDGRKIITNDDGSVVDKRQLLSAGLNIVKKPPLPSTSESASISARPSRANGRGGLTQAERERREKLQRDISEQKEQVEKKRLAAQESKEEEFVKKLARKVSDGAVNDAKARYLARKAAAAVASVATDNMDHCP